MRSLKFLESEPGPKRRGGTLRSRILAFVGGLVLLSLLGSTISLYRITEVNRSLDAINRVSVPLGRLLGQMQSDADVFKREMERRLGHTHWDDSHWRPKPVPRWIEDVLENEIERAAQLIKNDLPWSTPESKVRWIAWVERLSHHFIALRGEAHRLYTSLEQQDRDGAARIYPRWNAALDEWIRELHWGVNEYERSLRQTFALAQGRVAQLRTGLEIILVVVVALSLLLLWLGERALRPLGELTRLAREITRRGVRKEDKVALPDVPLSRRDEVSQLAREFHRMATALLEREKIVDHQQSRLQEQNRLLREMGELNENVLNSIKSVLIVTDLNGRVTQCNPIAASWLGGENASQVMGSDLRAWPNVRAFAGSEHWLSRVRENAEAFRIEPCEIDGRVVGGHLMPLWNERTGSDRAGDAGGAYGAILVIEDLTEELDLQERLRRAENLAAVGRLSAQVAHEVRNPLHSIGLEAEVAAEMAAKIGQAQLKQSLQSILVAVDRLEKITENYLKLSRLSAGEKTRVDVREILEAVLATYAPVCEAQGVKVTWNVPSGAGQGLCVWGDRELLEQVLGNLLRNALQALEEGAMDPCVDPSVQWTLGTAESGRIWLRVRDNGPGIAPEIRKKLFTPFVTTRAQGTGLGLSFVKKVLEDHGGAIECVEADAGSGLGACFDIVLPAAATTVKEADAERRRRENVEVDIVSG